MGSRLVKVFCLAGCTAFAMHGLCATPAVAEAAPAAAVADAEKPTPEEEMRQLERERSGILREIRSANDRAAQERAGVIQANPELAAIRDRIIRLERELKEARGELDFKMKAAGLKVSQAPGASLKGMDRMRQIDQRMRELMSQRAAAAAAAEEAPEAGRQPAAGGEAPDAP